MSQSQSKTTTRTVSCPRHAICSSSAQYWTEMQFVLCVSNAILMMIFLELLFHFVVSFRKIVVMMDCYYYYYWSTHTHTNSCLLWTAWAWWAYVLMASLVSAFLSWFCNWHFLILILDLIFVENLIGFLCEMRIPTKWSWGHSTLCQDTYSVKLSTWELINAK